MPNINEFVANFGRGARANKYRVELVYPSFVGEDGSTARFVCKAAQIPPSTIGVIEVPYMGRVFKMAGDRTFPEWTVTMSNQETFRHRKALERWSNAINAHEQNVAISTDYFARAIISPIDIQDNVIRQYTFENLWPSEVASIEVGFDNNDTIQEFSVTFQYSHWTSDTTS